MLLGTSVPPFWMQCLRTSCVGDDELSFIFHILAVLSPDPEANRSVVGFQAQMNTSDSCPLKTVALLAGISRPVSSSPLVSFELAEQRKKTKRISMQTNTGCQCRFQSTLLTISIHRLVAIRVLGLRLDNLRFLAVLQLLLPASNHIRHDGIDQRQTFHRPFRPVLVFNSNNQVSL